MHKQGLDGAREGDGKKVAGGANARARLETPPGFAARSRSNNVTKASMAVGERKAALPPPPASNGGKAGMFAVVFGSYEFVYCNCHITDLSSGVFALGLIYLRFREVNSWSIS